MPPHRFPKQQGGIIGIIGTLLIVCDLQAIKMGFCWNFVFFDGILLKLSPITSKLATSNSKQPSSNLQASKWTPFFHFLTKLDTTSVLIKLKVGDARAERPYMGCCINEFFFVSLQIEIFAKMCCTSA